MNNLVKNIQKWIQGPNLNFLSIASTIVPNIAILSNKMITLIYYHLMKITPQFSFLKFYVMGPTEINLYGIAHVKVDFILLQTMYSETDKFKHPISKVLQ